jgi:hypothetical protein
MSPHLTVLGMVQNDPMPTIISTILLVLAVVLVVLTRLRLAKEDQPVVGRADIPTSVVNAHTAVGAVAIVVWGAYVFVGVDWLVGFLGLFLWWITSAIGLLILMRWMPARGRHAAAGETKDEWSEGPWLSILGHVGALVGAFAWTAFFVTDSLS